MDPLKEDFSRIYEVIRKIPRGRVATYGQIATLAGLPGRARMVGYALRMSAGVPRLPWQRVINAQGRISARDSGSMRQRECLEREGVKFSPAGKIDLDRYLWDPGPGAMAGKPLKRRRATPI